QAPHQSRQLSRGAFLQAPLPRSGWAWVYCSSLEHRRCRIARKHVACVSHNALAKDTPAEKQAKPKIDVCFVLDTTGSMSGLIEGAKQKIWSIANLFHI